MLFDPPEYHADVSERLYGGRSTRGSEAICCRRRTLSSLMRFLRALCTYSAGEDTCVPFHIEFRFAAGHWRCVFDTFVNYWNVFRARRFSGSREVLHAAANTCPRDVKVSPCQQVLTPLAINSDARRYGELAHVSPCSPRDWQHFAQARDVDHRNQRQ